MFTFEIPHQYFLDQGIDEVKLRNVEALYSKVEKKLIQGEQLAINYPELPAVMMNFINSYQMKAQPEIIRKLVIVLITYGDVPHLPFSVKILTLVPNMRKQNQPGSKILCDYGAIEFFTEFRQNFKQQPSVAESVELLLQTLVRYRSSRSEKIKTLYTFRIPTLIFRNTQTHFLFVVLSSTS